jgi:hypothetical protein
MRHFLLSSLQDLGCRVEQDDQIRLGRKPPNHTQHPYRSAVSIAFLIHQDVDEAPVGLLGACLSVVLVAIVWTGLAAMLAWRMKMGASLLFVLRCSDEEIRRAGDSLR